MEDRLTLFWVLSAAFLLFCAYFTASVSAMVGVNDATLKERANTKDKQAIRLYEYLHRPQNIVETIRTASWICCVTAAILAVVPFFIGWAQILILWLESPLLVAVISCILTIFLILLLSIPFAFRIPQMLGTRYCETFGYYTVGVLRVLLVPFLPMIFLTRIISTVFARLLGTNLNEIEEAVTEEEIRMLVDAGNEIGVIEESQKEMINNIFEFDDTTAEEVMTHRTEVVAVEKNAKISEVVYLAINEGFSRMPVYEKDLDNILGLIYVKDLLCLVGCNSSEDFKITDFIRPTFYVPESTRCRALFAEFKKNKAHIAVVVDEYGGTAGIVSLEDILESIVGDIEDEYDESEEEIQHLSDDIYIISGMIDLEDVGELLHLVFEEDEDFDTLGGFVVHVLGRIPKDDETPFIEYGGYRFSILSMDDRRVDKVKVQKLGDGTHSDREETV